MWMQAFLIATKRKKKDELWKNCTPNSGRKVNACNKLVCVKERKDVANFFWNFLTKFCVVEIEKIWQFFFSGSTISRQISVQKVEQLCFHIYLILLRLWGHVHCTIHLCLKKKFGHAPSNCIFFQFHFVLRDINGSALRFHWPFSDGFQCVKKCVAYSQSKYFFSSFFGNFNVKEK